MSEVSEVGQSNVDRCATLDIPDFLDFLLIQREQIYVSILDCLYMKSRKYVFRF